MDSKSQQIMGHIMVGRRAMGRQALVEATAEPAEAELMTGAMAMAILQTHLSNNV